jgi:hypothetical protein
VLTGRIYQRGPLEGLYDGAGGNGVPFRPALYHDVVPGTNDGAARSAADSCSARRLLILTGSSACSDILSVVTMNVLHNTDTTCPTIFRSWDGATVSFRPFAKSHPDEHRTGSGRDGETGRIAVDKLFRGEKAEDVIISSKIVPRATCTPREKKRMSRRLRRRQVRHTRVCRYGLPNNCQYNDNSLYN